MRLSQLSLTRSAGGKIEEEDEAEPGQQDDEDVLLLGDAPKPSLLDGRRGRRGVGNLPVCASSAGRFAVSITVCLSAEAAGTCRVGTARGQTPGAPLVVGVDRALDEPVLVGDARRLGAVLHAELAVDVRQVELHRLRRDPELLGDLVVREAARQRPEDRDLALGQARAPSALARSVSSPPIAV